MNDKKAKEAAESERRGAERRNNASLDFGIADRRKSERRSEAAKRG